MFWGRSQSLRRAWVTNIVWVYTNTSALHGLSWDPEGFCSFGLWRGWKSCVWQVSNEVPVGLTKRTRIIEAFSISALPKALVLVCVGVSWISVLLQCLKWEPRSGAAAASQKWGREGFITKAAFCLALVPRPHKYYKLTTLNREMINSHELPCIMDWLRWKAAIQTPPRASGCW